MQTERITSELGIILGKITEQIGELQKSYNYANQRIQVSNDSAEWGRANGYREMRERELAYWLDILAFARRNSIPSEQAMEQARSVVTGGSAVVGTGFMVEFPPNDRYADGMPTPRTWETLQAARERAQQHTRDPRMTRE